MDGQAALHSSICVDDASEYLQTGHDIQYFGNPDCPDLSHSRYGAEGALSELRPCSKLSLILANFSGNSAEESSPQHARVQWWECQ